MAGQGRLLVVDEAFMDATDEAESLIEPHMAGRLVLRSLSKTWGLAGLVGRLRGGRPGTDRRPERMQPPWSVSSPAIAAMIATASPKRLRPPPWQRQCANAGFGSWPTFAPPASECPTCTPLSC